MSMRELRTCDFCTADAAGAFELLPPELNPTEAEQRRVVLCPACRERLEDLLEPLLARAGVDVAGSENGDGSDDGESGDGDAPENAAGPRTSDRGSPGSDDDDDAISLGRAPDSSVRVRANETNPPITEDASEGKRESGGENDEGTSPTDGTDASSSEDAETSADESRGESTGDAEITVEPDEDEREPTDGDEPDTRAGRTTSTRSRSQSQTAGERPPRAYAKVIRLLRNREFPMERAAVESLAASAYDLENHEVEAIVEHAIERGEFREEDGRLHRA